MSIKLTLLTPLIVTCNGFINFITAKKLAFKTCLGWLSTPMLYPKRNDSPKATIVVEKARLTLSAPAYNTSFLHQQPHHFFCVITIRLKYFAPLSHVNRCRNYLNELRPSAPFDVLCLNRL